MKARWGLWCMSSGGTRTLDWWPAGTVPAGPSIVWCNFPGHLNLGEPGPKARPALVFKSRYAAEPPDGRFLVLVAYGTSKLKVGKRPHDFVIGNQTLMDALRLPQATRFDLDNMLWLPWAREFFCSRAPEERGATPTLSVLTDDLRRILGWTMQQREKLGLNGKFHGAAAPVAIGQSGE